MATSSLLEVRQIRDDCLYTDTPRPRALVPLENVFSTLFRLFRLFWLFPRIQAALAYPTNRSRQNGENTRKTLVYGFWPS